MLWYDAGCGCPVVQVARAGGGGTAPEPGAGGGAAEPSGSQQSGRLEHMDTVMLHSEVPRQYVDLDLAENELGNFCSSLPADADADKCWQASAAVLRR